LVDRLRELETRVDAGDEAAWAAYCAAAATLAAIVPQAMPGANGQLLSTREMAERLNISPKTLLRRKKDRQITPALQLGKRGRASLRWKA